MKTKKDLKLRIKELELLIQQKDDMIAILKQQINPIVPQFPDYIPPVDITPVFVPPFVFDCNHEWNFYDNITAPYKTCKKCPASEPIFNNYGNYSTTQARL